jgi:uncharacterized protein YxeA
MRKLIIKIIALTLSIICSTFINIKAQEGDTNSNPYAKEFNKFKEQNQKQFDDYRAQIEKEFSDYLRKSWKEFTGKEVYKKETKPKPVNTPKYEATEIQNTEKADILIAEKQEDYKTQAFVQPQESLIPAINIQLSYDSISYFGSKCVFGYDKKMIFDIPASINENYIADYWDKLNKSSFENLIIRVRYYCSLYNVNDWGYYLMAKKISEKFYPNSNNGKVLLRWYIMTRLGFRAKLGLADGSAILLIPFKNKIYNCSGIWINGMYYYNIESKVVRLRTYEKDFPDAVKQIDMTVWQPLNLPVDTIIKSLVLTYQDNTFPIKIKYNKNVINYFKEFPSTLDLKVYFNSVASVNFKESVVESFTPYLKDKSEKEIADILLSFMHFSFDYKTDQEQFGYEKFNFPEESLFYQYIDCDDRSILFSYLIKELTNFEVIGLDYPTHVSTAVHFSGNIEGNAILYNNKRFLSCDPTYTGSVTGMIMPKFYKVVPKIVIIKNEKEIKQEEDKLWELANKSGGYYASSQQNMVFDKEGNKYIAGYYSDSAKFGAVRLINKGMKGGFVAKYTPDNQLIWVKAPDCQKNSLINYITYSDEDIYISGFFENSMKIGNKKLSSLKGQDIFMARLDKNGNVLWAEKAGLDTIKKTTNAIYVMKMDADGALDGIKFYENDGNVSNYGLAIDTTGVVYLTSATNYAIGFSDKSAAAYASADVPSLLKAENDKLIGMKYEKGIAGLFAAINLIKDNRAVLPGKEVKKALDKYNPSFKTSSPKIYEALGNITFIANNNGIIIVQTVDGDDILIDKIKMESDAKIKINILANGDAVIDVLSGVKVGKVVVWYKMNFIKLFKTSGDLLFDYDSDHTQKRVNLKKDILY